MVCRRRHATSLSTRWIVTSKNGKRNKVAFIWAAEEGEASFQREESDLWRAFARVNQCANALKAMGVKEGDRVTIYMALTPELPIAMLACARIGAIHCVVYAGFSAPALRQRIEDSGSKVVICSDMGYRRGKRVDLKGIVDEATHGLHSVEHILVFRRGHTPLELNEPKELDWNETLDAQSTELRTRSFEFGSAAFLSLYIGHDRQTQRHRPRSRRLCGRHELHPPNRVRFARRRYFLLHRRSGLDYRPFLCGLWAAD